MNALLVDLMPPLPPPTEPPLMPPVRPGPRFIRSITFAALPTAITCTRLFVASTLQLWGARFLEADAELLAVELVRHSIQACGVTDERVRLSDLEYLNVIHVRLLGFECTIGIEVWDNVTEPVQLPDHHGYELHGLSLVDARAKNWGSPSPRRAEWCGPNSTSTTARHRGCRSAPGSPARPPVRPRARKATRRRTLISCAECETA